MGINVDLLDQMAFYGAYHRNKWNQLIHFVFVPCILWTVMVWLSYSGDLLPTPSMIPSFAVLNAAFIAVATYSMFYLCMEPAAGLSWVLVMGLPLWLTATQFSQQVEGAWAWAIPLHVFSWYMQIHPGHAILEKRKPALLDSLVQAFALAPLFVWFELLFLLGYRRDFKAQLDKRIDEDVKKWQQKKAQ